MSSCLRIRPSLGVALLMSSFCHVGCGGGAAQPDASPQPDAPVAAGPQAAVSLALDLSSYFQLEVPAGTAVIAAAHVVRGTMTAAPTAGGPSQVLDWTVVLDEETWIVESSKSIVLAPGTYQLTLVLDDGSHRYVGQTLATIQEGENRISMTVRPVLGEVAIQPDVTELPVFRLQYPADQLARLSNPRIGVIIDDGPEQIVALNPATGLSDLYISLADGPHRVQLRLYDGSLQHGRSVAAQEAVIVRAGEDLVMDIEPLHGETVFDLIEQGGRLAIRIQVPGVVVEEVGGLASLAAHFSFTCPGSAPVELTLDLVPLGGDYQAALVLDDTQYGMCAYTLTFVDRAATPEEQVASCSAAVEIGREDRSGECDLLLRRRALVGGEFLAIVGVNVLDEAWSPIAGAVISDGERVLGITGAGAFGPVGYVKLHVPAGTHQWTALDPASMRTGQAMVTVAPLDLQNIDIQLGQATAACSNTDQCPLPSRPHVQPSRTMR